MNFLSFSGVVTMISDFWLGANNDGGGCYQLFTVENETGNIVNFIISPDTYFVDHEAVKVGDPVTGFYDADAPVALIFPPQYSAIVMVKETAKQNVKVSFFNRQLVSSDGNLKLNLAPNTKILLENGQRFTRHPANRNLIVIYSATTRSIPAQTTPSKVIVMC